jgi:hypothetical protein
VPISCGFLAFLVVAARPSHIGNGSGILALVINGSEILVVARRDIDATWWTLGKYCREFDRSRPRLIQELQNGLRHRTIPEGREIDWHNPTVLRSLDVGASTVTFGHAKVSEGHIGYVREIVGIEVLPADAEVPAPAASASAQWTAAATRRLRAEGKISEKAMKVKAALARLLEAEAEADVKAGRLRKALKASYLEDQLIPWGIWPLSSFE